MFNFHYLFLSLIGLNWLVTVATQSDQFSNNIFNEIATYRTNQNVILSPASIKTCLALTFIGARGETANELQRTLHLQSSSKKQAAQEFQNLLAKTKISGAKLNIANRIYLQRNVPINPKFNDIAYKYFDAAAKTIDFTAPSAANEINQWVESKTDNKIKNLVAPNDVGADTVAVLVNAINFKAKWENPFDSNFNSRQEFQTAPGHTRPVDMMFQQDRFKSGKIPALDAAAIELPYIDTDIIMLIILPNKIDGLANLEANLKNVDLSKIRQYLNPNAVRLTMPKFKMEFEISLPDVLKRLGIRTMFGNNADFSNLTGSNVPIYISEAKHKAFIEVNEVGTEAFAGTSSVPSFRSSFFSSYDFIVDHPFFFAIMDAQNVYFTGHVVRPN